MNKMFAHYVDHGSQEVDEDGKEDDDVPCSVRFVHPATRFSQNQRQTLIVLRRCNNNKATVQKDEDGELYHHSDHPTNMRDHILYDTFVDVIKYSRPNFSENPTSNTTGNINPCMTSIYKPK